MGMKAQDVQLGRVEVALFDDSSTEVPTYCLADIVYERAIFSYLLDLTTSCDLGRALVGQTYVQKVRNRDLKTCSV